MKVLKEVTATSFIKSVLKDRDRRGYGNQAIADGYYFAFHQKFTETGPEYFKSANKDEPIDEELFILETVSDGTFGLQEAIGLLARFFCGIQVFKERENWNKNRLYDLLFKDLSRYVTDKMLNEKVQYVKQMLEMN